MERRPERADPKVDPRVARDPRRVQPSAGREVPEGEEQPSPEADRAREAVLGRVTHPSQPIQRTEVREERGS